MASKGKGMSESKYENAAPAQQDNPDDDFETRYLIQLLREDSIWEKRRKAADLVRCHNQSIRNVRA